MQIVFSTDSHCASSNANINSMFTSHRSSFHDERQYTEDGDAERYNSCRLHGRLRLQHLKDANAISVGLLMSSIQAALGIRVTANTQGGTVENSGSVVYLSASTDP